MEIAGLIVGIVAVVVAVGTLIVTCRIAKRQEKQQRQLAKQQEEFARIQQREQLRFEICQQLFSLLPAYYDKLITAVSNEDLEKLEELWIRLDTLLAIKMQLENLQANEQHLSQAQSFNSLDSVDYSCAACRNVAVRVHNFQNSALDFKNGVFIPQSIATRRSWGFKGFKREDYLKQIEKSRLEKQGAMRKAYKDAMVALGKVITSRLDTKT